MDICISADINSMLVRHHCLFAACSIATILFQTKAALIYLKHPFVTRHTTCIRCIAYGVLPEDEAAKVYKMVVKRKGSKKSTSSSPKPTSSASTKKKKSKKVMEDVEYDAGMGAGGDEGIGVTAM